MVAKLKVVNDKLIAARKEYDAKPTKQLEKEVASLAKKRKEIRKKKSDAKKTSKENAKLPGPVKATTTAKVEAETPTIDFKPSEVQAEMQEKATDIDKAVIKAQRKASKAKIAADKAVVELKSLRSKGNASDNEITAAREKVKSSIKKAARCETNVILAEDELQASAPPNIVATAEVAATDTLDGELDDNEDGVFGDDNDSIGSYKSPSPKAPSPLPIPEFFKMPTPPQTVSSPTTGTASPAKGSNDNPMSVENYKATIDSGSKRDLKLRETFKSRLAANDPVATLVDEYIKLLNGRPHLLIGSASVRDITLMRLLDGTWLEEETITVYLELLVRGNTHFQIISSRKITWELTALHSEGGPEKGTFADFDVEDGTRCFLLPTNVSDNHWMLCVARLPDADGREGTLDWYNSLHSPDWDVMCKQSAFDVVEVLLWLGEIPGSPLHNVSWKLNKGSCGKQTNSDDCGVFVDAVAASIVLDAPIPQNVHGFRRHMASQIVKAAKGEVLDWTEVQDMLTPVGVVLGIQSDTEDKDEGMQEDDNGEAEGEEVEDNGMVETEYQCNICWYHYASSEETLDIHKREKHNTEPFLCEWPSCRAIMPDQEALDAHYRHIHERKMWVCPIRTCHRRFITEAETLQHIEDEHTGVEHDTPGILDGNFRTFKLADLRDIRERANAAWKLKCGSEDVERLQIRSLYDAYYSATPRKYFQQKGVIGQDLDADVKECRTIDRDYNKSRSGVTRPHENYSFTRNRVMTRSYAWWVLFLHQAEGPELDAFIRNTLLGGPNFQISHKCHWAFCYVVSHLEQVMSMENSDRSVCKNGSRARDGGCNALQSLHPHDHCLLGLSRGTGFDTKPPWPLHETHKVPSKKRKRVEPVGRDEESQEKAPKRRKAGWLPRVERKGPCAEEGCLTPGRRGWMQDPEDLSRQLCCRCYKNVMHRRNRKLAPKLAPTKRERGLIPPSERKGPCAAKGCITSSKDWMLDPTDPSRQLCWSCYTWLLITRKRR